MKPVIKGLDHIVITVSNMRRSCNWYETMLGMKTQTFISPSDPSKTRVALLFGDQKINLHEKDMKVNPMAQHPLPGSTDLCFYTDQPVSHILKHWQDSISVNEAGGPLVLENNQHIVQRTGAHGSLTSIYIYDPDGNLIEVANRSA
ncbi:unnamed protein product [Absidia cylindrospora]